MTRPAADRIDRVARRLAGFRPPPAPLQADAPTGESRFDRSFLLRSSAIGLLALSLRGVPPARAAVPAVADSCPGGSLNACYGRVEKNFNRFLRDICDATLKDDPFGTQSYICYVGLLETRQQVRQQCRSKCKKPKRPAQPPTPPTGPAPPGPNPLPPPPPPPIPTCGQVDCVDGDVCCKAGGDYVCCAIGCARGGANGCCSSDSDC